jgi:methionyl-tRNA formyltransferase
MKLLYAGTADFAVPALSLLAQHHRVLAVLTQPDRAAGRGRHSHKSAVKAKAEGLGLELLQPERLDAAACERIESYAPDALVVAAYGLLLPKRLLAFPRHGALNIHGSLLPRWRGAAPVQRAIEAGDAETGVAIMQMSEGLDQGPVYALNRLAIGARETSGELGARLAREGARLLLEVLAALEQGAISARAQEEAGASYAKKLTKAEARIDWSAPAALIERRVRAFLPWPVAETAYRGAPLKVLAAELAEGSGAPGTVLAAEALGIRVAAGSGALRLTRVQAAGGKPLAAREFLNGAGRGIAGAMLGP